MLSVERIRRTIAFEVCDRPPVVAQVFGHAALASGRSLDAYLASGAVAAACQIEARARYGYDAVFAVLDLTLEAEAAGAEVQCHPGLYPAVSRPPYCTDHDFRRLTVPDPRSAARLPMVLEMAACLRDALGDEALVVGLVQGPMTLAVQFLGIEKALFLAADEPDRFLQLLDHTARVATAFGLAQLEAGAHLVMVFEPAACQEVVPLGVFREMIGPRLASLFSTFAKKGAIGNWLHVAGKTASLLPRYAALGADIGNFDYCVDPEALLAVLGDSRLCLDGNLRSLSFLTDSPAAVEEESRHLLRLFDRRGGFILSSGCEIPPESREVTIEAMVRTGLAWKSGQGVT